MDYKNYYNEIKEKISVYSDVIYYEPLSEIKILEIEKIIGQSIKPLYREYLLAFGLTQDVFNTLTNGIDVFFENLDFIEDSLKGYLPIFSDSDLDDIIYIINNNDLLDDFIYKVVVGNNDKIGKIKKLKPFQNTIDESVIKLTKNYKKRCLNKDKINIAEFIIPGEDFSNFIKVFKSYGLEQKTDWKPKYYPYNIFGDEIAIFELFENTITIQRDEDSSNYEFEIDEPILIKNEKSFTIKIEDLLKAHQIKHEINHTKLFET